MGLGLLLLILIKGHLLYLELGRYRHKTKIDVTKQIDVGDGYMLIPIPKPRN